ncbi:bifunctional glycosyltransferase family 2/GtrA family protein [Acrocarpospora catenulata]|uniref:bifunctional glycosyltransferase family 2/GtrA family protein n=1 Tax=Acrocarpospora catenulata TaxID=2836182 RepID=UPI001BDAB4E9|nr:bifunctional glycosyltransferase family 2/GtrA family protein [Acrocarpospora catenulata]
MSTTTVFPPPAEASNRTRLVEIVVPVHNERRVLADSIRRLHAHLSRDFPYGFRVTIADNASTDDTWAIAEDLARELPGVRAIHLSEKGRGRALRRVWTLSDADVVSYMDVDLSTDLDAFLPLIAPLMSGHSDLAIGTRLSAAANVVRGPKRELVSRAYNLLLRAVLGARFSDAQCGFKAARTEVVQALLPAVEDEGWFFDTELLLLAERHGLRIHEVPVDWVDDPDSRVDIVRTALDDLRGLARVARVTLSDGGDLVTARRTGPGGGMARQIPVFVVVGLVSTLAYLVLYSGFRLALPSVAANFLALLVTAVANTAANRRFTFGVRARAGMVRHQLEGLIAFAVGLAVTTAALASLPATASRLVELVTVIGANLVATVVRFALLRGWVFHPNRRVR